MKTYLDNAATSRKKPLSLYTSLFKNTLLNSINAGRGTYKKSIGAVKQISDTAESLAELFNIEDSSQIAFTQNATYALNFLIQGYGAPQDHIIITQMEHNSVLRPVHKLRNYTIVEADSKGNISPKKIKSAIKKNTKLIISTHASNVCGTIEPIEDIGRIAHDANIAFLVDASQTAGILDIDVQKMNIDMLAFSGHKGLMGPLGTGGLYFNKKIHLNPIITGGTGSMSESLEQPDIMPDMFHSGTQNTPAILALKKSVEFIKRHQKEIFEKEFDLSQKFIHELLNMDNIIVYGNIQENRNATVAFNILNKDCITVGEALDAQYGISVRSGFHCAPLAHKALKTEKYGCIRASFGYFNNYNDVKKIINAINKIQKNGHNN